jgi:CDP-glucose 4,6-dehydratase
MSGENGYGPRRLFDEPAAKVWSQRNIMVTGVTGFVGGRIANALLEMGARVVSIVRDGNPSRLAFDDQRRQPVFVAGRLEDYAIIERALNEYEVDTCLHVAAQAIVGVANRSPLSTFESNLKGTWNVLEACRQSKLVERVVVASSDKAYGVQADLPYTEDAPLQGLFPYDASKACTDILARSYAVTFGLPVAVTRCANIYGGGDTNWSRLIPGTIRSILNGQRPIIRSDGTPERDYIHADDAVRAYLFLASNVTRPEIIGEAFNFGSGQPLSARSLVDRILRAAGSDLEPDIQGKGLPRGEIDRQYLSYGKAERMLNWKPQVSLDDGIGEAIAWYSSYLNVSGTRQEPLTV